MKQEVAKHGACGRIRNCDMNLDGSDSRGKTFTGVRRQTYGGIKMWGEGNLGLNAVIEKSTPLLDRDNFFRRNEK